MPWSTSNAAPGTASIVTTKGDTQLNSGNSYLNVSPVFNIASPSYKLILSAYANNTSTTVALQITLSWLLSDGTLIDEQDWFILPSNATVNGAHTVIIKGPAEATNLQITVQGTGGSNIDFYYKLISSGVNYTRHDGRSYWPSGSSPNFDAYATGTTAIPQSDLLLAAQPSIGHGNTQLRVLPLYAGQVTVGIQTTSGAADMVLSVQDVGMMNFGVASTPAVVSIQTSSAGYANTTFSLARSQCQVTIFNNNTTTTETCRVWIVASELVV